ncbi:unnamed protein product [Cuscuta campestris]|uniref:Uncharacterized protein n=1 Tax=Cuscuta campestris TaxID=132261 RepID=A0A484KLG8_9ASTE|nr:unnamed protein product [Cuscuta campestris]
MFEVLPGNANCSGFVYFHSRKDKAFISDVPPGHKKWKTRFVFIDFPKGEFPFDGELQWGDRLPESEDVYLATTPGLEKDCAALLKGDPTTGKAFSFGNWTHRVPSLDEGTPRSNEAEADRVATPESNAEAGSTHSEMNFRSYADPEDEVEDLETSYGNVTSPQVDHNHSTGINDQVIHDVQSEKNQGHESPLYQGPSQVDDVAEVAGQSKIPTGTTEKTSTEKRKRSSHKSSRSHSKTRKGDPQCRDPKYAEMSAEQLLLAIAQKLHGHGEFSEAFSRRILGTGDDESQRLQRMLDAAHEEIKTHVTNANQVKTYLEQVNLENNKMKFSVREKDEEINRLKEENERLNDALVKREEEVRTLEADSRAKDEMFPARAVEWAGQHYAEVARAVTATPDGTKDFFEVLFKEPEGKKMTTEIGFYGFMMGQKAERTGMYRLMQKRDPKFEAVAWKLPPLHKDEPVPPFPLE